MTMGDKIREGVLRLNVNMWQAVGGSKPLDHIGNGLTYQLLSVSTFSLPTLPSIIDRKQDTSHIAASK